MKFGMKVTAAAAAIALLGPAVVSANERFDRIAGELDAGGTVFSVCTMPDAGYGITAELEKLFNDAVANIPAEESDRETAEAVEKILFTAGFQSVRGMGMSSILISDDDAAEPLYRHKFIVETVDGDAYWMPRVFGYANSDLSSIVAELPASTISVMSLNVDLSAVREWQSMLPLDENESKKFEKITGISGNFTFASFSSDGAIGVYFSMPECEVSDECCGETMVANGRRYFFPDAETRANYEKSAKGITLPWEQSVSDAAGFFYVAGDLMELCGEPFAELKKFAVDYNDESFGVLTRGENGFRMDALSHTDLPGAAALFISRGLLPCAILKIKAEMGNDIDVLAYSEYLNDNGGNFPSDEDIAAVEAQLGGVNGVDFIYSAPPAEEKDSDIVILISAPKDGSCDVISVSKGTAVVSFFEFDPEKGMTGVVTAAQAENPMPEKVFRHWLDLAAAFDAKN